MRCLQCNSEINIQKAIRRSELKGGKFALCACGKPLWLWESRVTHKAYWMGTTDETQYDTDVQHQLTGR